MSATVQQTRLAHPTPHPPPHPTHPTLTPSHPTAIPPTLIDPVQPSPCDAPARPARPLVSRSVAAVSGAGGEPLAMTVRSGEPADAEGICALINHWAQEGLTLRRTLEEVEASVAEFVVAVVEGRVIACGALVVFSPALAEIRSVAIAPEAKGFGAGTAVVRFLVEQAETMSLDRVVLLTKIPAYFAKFGFGEITRHDLPDEFIAEFITARGRKLEGRSIMARSLLR